MNFTGLIFACITLAAVGIGFLWVIKLEYYVGAHLAWPVGIFGGVVVLASLLVPGFAASAVVGILGGTIVWGATELPDQEKRVKDGIFPANPKKQRGGSP
jgi:uncharacterized protein DUF4491